MTPPFKGVTPVTVTGARATLGRAMNKMLENTGGAWPKMGKSGPDNHRPDPRRQDFILHRKWALGWAVLALANIAPR